MRCKATDTVENSPGVSEPGTQVDGQGNPPVSEDTCAESDAKRKAWLIDEIERLTGERPGPNSRLDTLEAKFEKAKLAEKDCPMAATVITDDVRGYCITGADAMHRDFIAVVDGADVCLDKNRVPEHLQRILKINAMGHLATLSAGGQIRSQSAPSGASRSFATPSGSGVDSTNWGSALRSLDSTGCVTRMLQSDKARPFIAVMG